MDTKPPRSLKRAPAGIVDRCLHLESMSKTGLPSRAECVMLNKGQHVVDAVKVLDDVPGRRKRHQNKKIAMLRRLSISNAGSRVRKAKTKAKAASHMVGVVR